MSTVLFVPCYNERGRIGGLLQRIATVGVVDEVVVVDDGSDDGSVDEIRAAAPGCALYRHPRRRGLGEGFRTAYRHTLEAGHDVFCVMAGNGKDDPAEIPRVVGPVLEGSADYVQGSRFHQHGGRSERLPAHRGVAIRVFTAAASLVCGRRFRDCSNGFRAYRTTLLTDERIDWCAPWLGTSYQIEIHLLVAACRLGYRVQEVPATKVYPDDGKPYSKAAIADWFRMVKPLGYAALALDRPRGARTAPGEHRDVERLQ